MNILAPIFTYPEFFEWMGVLSKEGKSSGEDQNEVMADYTSLINKRMKRLNNTVKLQPDFIKILESIEKPQTWYLFTET